MVQRAKKAKEVEIRRKKEETKESGMQIKRLVLLEEELKKTGKKSVEELY